MYELFLGEGNREENEIEWKEETAETGRCVRASR